MERKPKLSKELSIQLAGLSTQERLDKLREWRTLGLITKQIYDYFARTWKEKEVKRATGPLFNQEQTKRHCPTLAAEGEINVIIDNLYSKIKDYKISGIVREYPSDDFKKFKKYVEKYFVVCRRKVNQMLILGMRVPDESKRLTEFCRSWICYPGYHYFGDKRFWLELWQCRFVPHDAIDMMLVKTENGFKINNLFDDALIAELIPKIEQHRGYEQWRLERAENEKDKSRRAKRLAAFDTLLKAANEYCK